MAKQIQAGDQFPLLAKKKNELSKVIQSNIAGQQVSPFTFERSVVPSGGSTQWTVATEDGNELRDAITGVIVCCYDTRAYWIGSEESSELSSSPPDCSSLDCETGNGRRTEGEESGRWDCNACPKAEWESGRDGRGQACKVKKRVFLITPDSLMPIPIAVFLPPTSLQAFVKYIMGLLRFGLEPHEVVTELTLVADRSGKGEPFARVVPKNIGRVSKLYGDDAPAKFKAIADGLEPVLRTARIDDWDEAGE